MMDVSVNEAVIDGLLNCIPISFLVEQDIDSDDDEESEPEEKEVMKTSGKPIRKRDRMFDPMLSCSTVEHLIKHAETSKPNKSKNKPKKQVKPAGEKTENHGSLREKLHAKIRDLQNERKAAQSARDRVAYEAYAGKKAENDPNWKPNQRSKTDRPSLDDIDEETKKQWAEERSAKRKADSNNVGAKKQKIDKNQPKNDKKRAVPEKEAEIEEDIDFSSMQFQKNKADAPLDTWVNKPGTKAKRLQREIAAAEKAQQEAEDRKANMDSSELADLSKQEGLEKAMQRAGGVKVRDDLKRLKKTQKTIQKQKNESVTKWTERQTNAKDSAAEKLDRRNHNIQKKRDKHSYANKTKKLRPGFEGKKKTSS